MHHREQEPEMNELLEMEAVKALKYRYFRALDCTLWDELESCFSETAVCSYSGGKYAFEGRQKIMGFLSSALTNQVISMHHGHHPEIEITGPHTATGVWYLEDKVINLDNNTTLMGTGIYEDTYAKEDGHWVFTYTGYERIFEEVFKRDEIPSLALTANRFAP
jgi:hypothetical protein